MISMNLDPEERKMVGDGEVGGWGLNETPLED